MTGELGQLALCFALALSLVMAAGGLAGGRPDAAAFWAHSERGSGTTQICTPHIAAMQQRQKPHTELPPPRGRWRAKPPQSCGPHTRSNTA